MARSLFEVLSFDERIIVYSSEEDRQFYTWNQADTFQCWSECADGWEETGILCKSGYGPKNYKEARERAIEWHIDSGSLAYPPRYMTERG